jgi:hypothetical protein
MLWAKLFVLRKHIILWHDKDLGRNKVDHKTFLVGLQIAMD